MPHEKVLVRAYPISWISFVSLLFGVVLFCVLGFTLIWQGGTSEIVGSFFALALAATILIWFLYSFPIITITTQRITIVSIFWRRVVDLTDIKSIGLMRKSFLTFLWTDTPMESTRIMTEDFKELLLWDSYYYNTHRVKLLLEKVQEQVRSGTKDFSGLATEFTKTRPTTLKKATQFSFQEYKGSWLLTFNGISFAAIIVFFGWIAVNYRAIYFGGGFCVLFFFVFGFAFHYYQLSAHELIIRNHLWPWMSRRYNFTNIKEIVLEAPGNMPKTLKVRTIDYRTRMFPGSSLRNKTFRKMAKELTARGVFVRNELVLID